MPAWPKAKTTDTAELPKLLTPRVARLGFCSRSSLRCAPRVADKDGGTRIQYEAAQGQLMGVLGSVPRTLPPTQATCSWPTVHRHTCSILTQQDATRSVITLIKQKVQHTSRIQRGVSYPAEGGRLSSDAGETFAGKQHVRKRILPAGIKARSPTPSALYSYYIATVRVHTRSKVKRSSTASSRDRTSRVPSSTIWAGSL